MSEQRDNSIDVERPSGAVGERALQEQFLRLFAESRNQVFAYIFSLLPSHDDAEDVFQRVSLILWRKFEEFDQAGSFVSWACGVAFYEVKNFLRVAQRDRLQFRDELIRQLADERLATLEQQESKMTALRLCLDKVLPRDRELLDCAYRDRKSLKVAAETTGLSVQTLYNRLNLVRRQLFDCIQRRLSASGEMA